MRLILYVLVIFLGSLSLGWADERKVGDLSRLEIEKLLTLIEKKRTPNIYGAMYYPRWNKPLDGLKSVTVEAIAEYANKRMKDGVRLEIVGGPISMGDIGAVLLSRSGGGVEEGVFPAYLYHSGKDGWGFLGFPIPYQAPRILGKDGKFMATALNDLTPYDGVLYEFDQATKARYEQLSKKINAMLEAKQGDGDQPAVVPNGGSR